MHALTAALDCRMEAHCNISRRTAEIALGSISTNTWFLDERDEKADFVNVREVDSFPDASIAVIGIDGADFSIAKPMIVRGELPHLAGLMARGQHGVLRSLKPSLSPVAWTTIFSGHPAVVHGLHSWATSENRNRRVPMLWDIFGVHGNSSLVVNVPGTWPPAPIENGTILAGFPIPSIISGGRGQLLGSIVSSVPDEQGAVTTERAHADSQGRFRFDIAIATPHVQPKLAGVTHPSIDGLAQNGLMLMICPAQDIGPESIVSYTAEGYGRADSEASREVQIDASREEQLRSLGYIE